MYFQTWRYFTLNMYTAQYRRSKYGTSKLFNRRFPCGNLSGFTNVLYVIGAVFKNQDSRHGLFVL